MLFFACRTLPISQALLVSGDADEARFPLRSFARRRGIAHDLFVFIWIFMSITCPGFADQVILFALNWLSPRTWEMANSDYFIYVQQI